MTHGAQSTTRFCTDCWRSGLPVFARRGSRACVSKAAYTRQVGRSNCRPVVRSGSRDFLPRRGATEISTKCTDKMAEIVEPRRVARLCDRHSRQQERTGTSETHPNQVFVRWERDQLPKHSREQKWAHHHL